MQLILVGANHKSAKLTAREHLALGPERRVELIETLMQTSICREVVVLSTCNRTEIYAIVKDPEAAREHLVSSLLKHITLDRRALEDLLYTYYNKFAATHLFEVASGLDSMVLGENEILRQVKEALETAQRLESVGAVLNQLMRFAITAGKRVRTETGINEGCTSLGTLAARLVRKGLKPGGRLVLIGAGQIAQSLLRNVLDDCLQLTIVNRTRQRAEELADMYPGDVELADLGQLPEILPQADAIVTCTANSRPLVHPEDLAPHRAQLLIDLSVPRNIDPACAENPSVTLYDVDGLQSEIHLSMEQRNTYIAQAQTIIGEEAASFLAWFHNRDMVPTIRGMYGLFEEIRQNEVQRGTQKYKEQLTPEVEEIIERVTRAVTQKILHHPVARLKAAEAEEQQLYQNVLDTLFGLDAQDEIDKYVHRPTQQQRLQQRVHGNPGRPHA